ncbi:MAG: SDR family NAD(P)-dependent oxidoreductase, partial [Acidimicrobiia bacterium]|nr:SDR family NAD(P)-dependent oxidoreductase [Acidimicrobiia bacterium]
MDLELNDQSFIVTGGSSGIGLATTRVLLDEGALVTICGRSADRLAAAEKRLASRRVVGVAADVLDETQAASVIDAAVQHGGRLDGVAAVAGRGRHGTVLELSPPIVAREITDKVVGLLNIVQPALPSLIATGGRVVALTAPAAGSDPSMGAVGAGRSAVDSVVQ